MITLNTNYTTPFNNRKNVSFNGGKYIVIDYAKNKGTCELLYNEVSKMVCQEHIGGEFRTDSIVLDAANMISAVKKNVIAFLNKNKILFEEVNKNRH